MSRWAEFLLAHSKKKKITVNDKMSMVRCFSNADFVRSDRIKQQISAFGENVPHSKFENSVLFVEWENIYRYSGENTKYI